MNPLLHNVIYCVLMLLLTVGGNTYATPNTAAALVDVTIYSIEPTKILGIPQLKRHTTIAGVKVIDLSVIPRTESLFSAYANAEMNRQSIAEIKTLTAQLPQQQLRQLANAQLEFFNLRTRHDVTIDDLPLVIFEQGETSYLYEGNDAYRGFLLWQRANK